MTHLASSRTLAVRTAIESDAEHGAVVPPLHLSANFTHAGLGAPRRYDYTRTANPTRDALAEALAGLEGGAGAVVTASGMAAIHLVLAALPVGARVLAPHDCYGGTRRLLATLHEQGRLRVRFADLGDEAGLAAGLGERPELVWIETPSNPLLRVVDIEAVAARARAGGAVVAVDNTFLSPAWQQPLALGADLAVHSTTKYLNGHSDVVGGAVVAREADLHERLAWLANCLGLAGAPFDAYLTLRGVRTLHARLAVHEANAEALVERLCAHPAVARVHYPGLPGHPGHAVARRQQSSFGAMVSFELRGGIEAARAVVRRLRLFSLAESLGGVESLVAHPATMTHAAVSPEARRRAGIGDGLLRLSVGIEDPEDLAADLGAALDAALGAAGGVFRAPRTATG